ncbi:hypothetical protein [Azospirillum palustre]
MGQLLNPATSSIWRNAEGENPHDMGAGDVRKSAHFTALRHHCCGAA